MKRAFDVLMATVALVVLSPLMLATGVAVALRLGRPVLFRQQRPGLRGRPFVLYKFRTMRDLHDSAGSPLPDHRRMTPFGRLLRRTSLDELPELWNVLRGEMSIVGPRPLLMEYLPLYSAAQSRRHDVRPGLTGWAQVNGRNAISWDDKFALDLWYVEHRSFGLDLRIIAITLLRVLWRDGVSQEGHVTAEPFRGSSRPTP